MKVYLAILVLLKVFQSSLAATDKIFCYYGTWATYRTGNGKFDVENIDPNLCTHIIYTFVGLSSAGYVQLLDPNFDVNAGGLSRFRNLKQRNPNVKLMVAIGGWNQGSSTYSYVVNNPSLRAVLVNDIVAFVQRYGLDGFDLDWEYPGLRGGTPSDIAAFVQLLKELRPRFDQYGYILSAGVAAPPSYIQSSYDVRNLNIYLDFINLMSYDFRGSWDGFTGLHSGLYPSSSDVSASDRTLNTDAAVKAWIQAGASPQKIVVGVPLYGKSFTLQSASNNGVRAPTTGPGASGPYTLENGFLSYLEICEKQKQGGWTTVWNTQQQVPYAYNGLQWVGYENPQSVKVKADYAIANNLAGVMIWSIEDEDHKNVCGGGVYPLMNAIKNALKSSPGPIQPTPPTQVTTTSTVRPTQVTVQPTVPTVRPTNPPATTAPGTCPLSGYYRDANDCSVFYRCDPNNPRATSTRFQCGATLYFDAQLLVCNYSYLVKC